MSRRAARATPSTALRSLSGLAAALTVAVTLGACGTGAPTAPTGDDVRIRHDQTAPGDSTATDSTGRARTLANYQNPMV